MQLPRSLIMLAPACVAAVCLLPVVQTAGAGDRGVTLFNGGDRHTGVYDSAPLLHQPGLKWRFKVKHGASSPPLVHDGVVYFGDWGGMFYAVDVASGAEKWRYEGGYSTPGPPTIVGDTAY